MFGLGLFCLLAAATTVHPDNFCCFRTTSRSRCYFYFCRQLSAHIRPCGLVCIVCHWSNVMTRMVSTDLVNVFSQQVGLMTIGFDLCLSRLGGVSAPAHFPRHLCDGGSAGVCWLVLCPVLVWGLASVASTYAQLRRSVFYWCVVLFVFFRRRRGGADWLVL